LEEDEKWLMTEEKLLEQQNQTPFIPTSKTLENTNTKTVGQYQKSDCLLQVVQPQQDQSAKTGK
jgi:hypothetical protein